MIDWDKGNHAQKAGATNDSSDSDGACPVVRTVSETSSFCETISEQKSTVFPHGSGGVWWEVEISESHHTIKNKMDFQEHWFFANFHNITTFTTFVHNVATFLQRCNVFSQHCSTHNIFATLTMFLTTRIDVFVHNSMQSTFWQ